MPTTTTKKEEIMEYLHEKVFDPILRSATASNSVKQGVRLTMMRMSQRDAKGMLSYFWNAIVGTPKSIHFSEVMKREGFTRFEDVIEEFRARFTNSWLTK